MAKGLGSRKHLFHLVNPSPWPLLISISAFYAISGLGFYLHGVELGGYTFIYGLITLCYSAFFWFNDIIDEATRSGFHTKAVKRGLRLGFMLFIVSEIMLFAGFFWAFFHCSLCPSTEIGSHFPPVGIYPIEVLEFPLFNTCLLILSGISVTWAHNAMAIGSFKAAVDSFLITIFLGFFFVFLQIIEYKKLCLIILIVYTHVHLYVNGFTWMSCFSRCKFFNSLFSKTFTKAFFDNTLFGLCFCYLILTFCWYCLIFLFLTVYCWGSWI